MKFISTFLVAAVLVSIFTIFPVNANTNTDISFKEITGLELSDISRIVIQSGAAREEVPLDTSLANELFIAFQSTNFKVKTDNGDISDWSYMVFMYTSQSGESPKFKYSFPDGVIHKGEMYVLENDTNLLKLVESMFNSLTKEPENSGITKEPEHITLYEFLDPANNWVESIRITKTTDIGNEKQTDDSVKISEFMQFAKTVNITLCDEKNAINRDGYFITVKGSVSGEQWWRYAFISDGGVDRYSLMMSRNPWSAYSLDNENVLAVLEQFYNSFDDKIADDWALPEIERAIWLEILPKHLQNDYMESITRERFCELIFGLLEAKQPKEYKNPSSLKSYFEDCSNSAVDILCFNGIVSGKGDRIFDANGFLTRQEAATILYRLMNLYNLDCDTTTSGYDAETVYSDLEQVADWALDGVNTVSNAGIMKGDGSYFLPNFPYTHQQAVATVMRLYDEIIRQTTLMGKYGIKLIATAFIDKMPTTDNKTKEGYIMLDIKSTDMSEVISKFDFIDFKVVGYDGNLDISAPVSSRYVPTIRGSFPTSEESPPELLVTIKETASGETEIAKLKCVVSVVH